MQSNTHDIGVVETLPEVTLAIGRKTLQTSPASGAITVICSLSVKFPTLTAIVPGMMPPSLLRVASFTSFTSSSTGLLSSSRLISFDCELIEAASEPLPTFLVFSCSQNGTVSPEFLHPFLHDIVDFYIICHCHAIAFYQFEGL